jgi:hypothetical protein
MGIKKVGDASDREVWLETRKQYLTASSIYGWRGAEYADKKNAWYFEDNNREAICAEKFEGYEKEFPPYSVVSMAHGSFDEMNIIRKFEAGVGFKCEPDNSMMVNDRWPCLAATVDGFLHTDDDLGEPEVNFCQDTDEFAILRERITGRGTGILEIKKSISVAWARGQVPEYYVAQVHTQLAILDMPWAVICAECIFTDPKEKWRKYWDLRPTVIKRNPEWDRVLDKCNAEFELALDHNQPER